VSQSAFVLDETGDQFAEPGSRPWAIYFTNRAKLVRDQVHNDAERLRGLVERLEEHRAWEALGLPSFSILCATKLQLGSDEIDAIRKAKRGQTVGEVLALRPHGTNQFTEGGGNKSENITSIDQRGTGSAYRIAKLKRDAPEFADRLEAGEFGSVREAERAAGFPVPPRLTPLERVQRAIVRLSDSDKIALREWLGT